MNKLKIFIEKYTIYLNEYKINPISKIFLKFIDNLNNNYIRLNRDVMKGKMMMIMIKLNVNKL